ncbi:MAG: hypothetical protein JW712_00985 [Dehalococcoidales bacterium]|nr:hypothetical protein [Dehalococcoidales bacterium]
MNFASIAGTHGGFGQANYSTEEAAFIARAKLSGKAKVYRFVIVRRYCMTDFSAELPCAVAIIETKEGLKKASVTARIK